MAFTQVDAYDEFAYPNYSYPQTHPDRLGSLATLFGLLPAPVERCRVLELGSGDGTNLLPMALGLPESQFLGIDRAAQPIERGTKVITALNLKNVELRKVDLMASLSNLGQFDYIIAHGIYSWVPRAVRDRILQICRSCLSPQGVAYISYNVYPGCHLRETIRGMILLHTKDSKDPHERVAQSRALVKWLADAQTQTNAYSLLLREVRDSFAAKNDAAIYHDDLADVNEPLYFYRFIEHAAQYGLQFLSEGEYFDTQEYNYSPEVAQQLREQDTIGREQYLDLLEGRSFRQTLLCHREVNLDRSLPSDLVRQFYIKSQARPVTAQPDLASESVEEFRGPKECSIATSFPLAKAAMLYLGKIYPRATRFDELLTQSAQLLGRSWESSEAASEEAQSLAALIIKTHGAGLTEFHLHEPNFVLIPGERPLVSPLARLQAQQGSMLSTLLYQTVKFEDLLGRKLLLLLDGTRDRSALLRDFGQVITQTISETEHLNPESEKPLPLSADQLEEKLAELGRLGLLLA